MITRNVIISPGLLGAVLLALTLAAPTNAVGPPVVS